MKALFTILITCILFALDTHAQSPVDTSSYEEVEYTYEKKNSFTSVFYGQPGDAAAWSMLLPGAGQLYNKRWWKAPLIWAGEGYLIYNLANKNKSLAVWDDCWRGLVNDASYQCSGLTDIDSSTDAFAGRQSAKGARELAWLFFVAGHLIQSLEAFVDRHLINFDTSNDLGHQQFRLADEIVFQNQLFRPIQVFSVQLNLN